MSLATRFMGIEIKSPIFVSAQGPVSNVELDKHLELFCKYKEAGASAIVTDTIAPWGAKDENRLPIIADIISVKSQPPFGNMGFYLLGPYFPNVANQGYGIALVRSLKQILDIPVIASIGISQESESLAQLASKLENVGVDGIELNLGCPDFIIESSSWNNPNLEIVSEIVKSVCGAVQIPIGIKLSPDMDYLTLITDLEPLLGQRIMGITAINAPISIAPPNIYKRGVGSFHRTEYFSYGGTYGPWDRFLAYRCIAQIYHLVSKVMEKKVDISAVGGIVEPEHVIEMIMLGASSVQLSSIILWKGYRTLSKMLVFLSNFMDEMGFQRIEQMVGISHRYIKSSATEIFKDLEPIVKNGHYVPPYLATVNNEKCDACGICPTIPCLAIEFHEGLIGIDKKLCSGCGLCCQICPTQAMTLTNRE